MRLPYANAIKKRIKIRGKRLETVENTGFQSRFVI